MDSLPHRLEKKRIKADSVNFDGMNATLTSITLTLEEQKVIDFAREFYAQNGQVPPIRRLCRECNISAPWFYRKFGSLESFVEKVGLKVDKETSVRIRSTRKATRKHAGTRKPKPYQDSNPAMVVEGEGPKPRTASTFEEIQHNREVEEEARKERLEKTRVFASQIELLALDPDPEVSNPALDALSNILPVILKRKYGIQASLKDLVEAEHTLRQAQETRKKLHEKEIQLDDLSRKQEDERVQIKGEWEEIQQARKQNPQTIALQELVKTMQGEKKVLIDNLNEACSVNRNFRMVAIAWLGVLEQCGSCQKRFIRLLNPFPQVRAWFLGGQWGALSFETIDTSRLPSRT